jgi:hypothetical protein
MAIGDVAGDNNSHPCARAIGTVRCDWRLDVTWDGIPASPEPLSRQIAADPSSRRAPALAIA